MLEDTKIGGDKEMKQNQTQVSVLSLPLMCIDLSSKVYRIIKVDPKMTTHLSWGHVGWVEERNPTISHGLFWLFIVTVKMIQRYELYLQEKQQKM